MACLDDAGCRVITGNQGIDHAAVARFARRHRDALTGLFVQVLAVCAREGVHLLNKYLVFPSFWVS